MALAVPVTDPIAPLAMAAVLAARRKTRFELVDRPYGITDEALVARLLHHATAAGLREREEPVIRQALQIEAARILRNLLIDTLERRDDVVAIATDACWAASIPGWEQRLAYCLAVSCQKQDPKRRRADDPTAPLQHTYGLDIAAPDFTSQLTAAAARIAPNLACDAELYTAIQSEAADFRTTTLERILRQRAGLSGFKDDVAAAIALKPFEILHKAPAIDQMCLEHARAAAPAGNEYVFWRRLERWAQTIALRDAATDAKPIDDDVARTLVAPEEGSIEHLVNHLVGWAKALRHGSERTLDGFIKAAEEELRRAECRDALSPHNETHNNVLRAELTHVLDELRAERDAFDAMLTYLLLAMLPAARRRLVAILSLRKKPPLPANVVAHIAWLMTDIVQAGAPPAAGLAARLRLRRDAGLPASRIAKLEQLVADAPRRRAALAAVLAELESLPTTVPDDDVLGASVARAVAAAKPLDAGTVRTTRGQAEQELGDAAPVFARAFRRYGVQRQ